MADKTPPVTDATDDDAYDAFDTPIDEIDWDAVAEIQTAYDAIHAIDDPDDRRQAAREYFAELNEKATT